jgi:hypothetical protein
LRQLLIIRGCNAVYSEMNPQDLHFGADHFLRAITIPSHRIHGHWVDMEWVPSSKAPFEE